MINYLVGDATRPQVPGNKIIAHICNDAGGWGAGFVLALSKRWKEPEKQYRDWFKRKDDFELGEVLYVRVANDIWVANMIAQHGYMDRMSGVPIRYDALAKCLTDLHGTAQDHMASVHMPRIGTGLAGGKWDVIEPMIEQAFAPTVLGPGEEWKRPFKPTPEVYVYDLP